MDFRLVDLLLTATIATDGTYQPNHGKTQFEVGHTKQTAQWDYTLLQLAPLYRSVASDADWGRKQGMQGGRLGGICFPFLPSFLIFSMSSLKMNTKLFFWI